MKIVNTSPSELDGVHFKEDSLKDDIDNKYAIITQNLGLAFSLAFLFFSFNDFIKIRNEGLPYTLDESRVNLIVIVGLVTYFLAKGGRVYLAKWLLVIVIPILLFVLPGLAGVSKYDYIFWFPYGVIVFSILPLMICKWRGERFLMILSIVMVFLILLFIERLIFAGFSADDFIVNKYKHIFFMLKSEQLIVYILLNALIVYSRILQGKLELKLKLRNHRISEQKQELLAQNDKLIIAQKKLSDLNERIMEDQEALMKQNEDLLYYQSKVKRANEELEVRVKNRTQELEDRNARLKEYAFINAHLLRAPLCRIKGLTYLVEKEQNGNDEQLMALLKASNEELEEIIHKITTILTEEKALNRDLLYKLYSRDEIMKMNIKHGEEK